MDGEHVMREIVKRYGEEIYGDAQRLAAVIKDFFPAADNVPLTKNLVRAVEDGVPEKLLRVKAAGEDLERNVDRIFVAFRDENAIVHGVALEVVSLFSAALLGMMPLQAAAVRTGQNQIRTQAQQPGNPLSGVSLEATQKLFDSITTATPELVNQLILEGAYADGFDKDGWTPLMRAASSNGNPEVLQVLIDAGADVNKANKDEWTPSMLAASSNGNPEVLRVLINAGADVNKVNKDEQTSLMLVASGRGNLEILRILVGAGADVNKPDSYGRTPLMRAAFLNGNPEVLRVLIDAGADVNIKGRFDNKKALDYIEHNKNKKFITSSDEYKLLVLMTSPN
ncbi:MAG: ankyrin repeat domain-containing protein [Synergistaceae bacterium]|nr:ankyrin repeat domain-containing protein [Synergistaceae bacterium]